MILQLILQKIYLSNTIAKVILRYTQNDNLNKTNHTDKGYFIWRFFSKNNTSITTSAIPTQMPISATLKIG